MEQIERTVFFEIGKSTYLADIIKDNSKKYIKLTHTVNEGINKVQYSIKINPTILENLIVALTEFKEDYFKHIQSDGWQVNAKDQQKIISGYLKGVPIKELAMRFDTKVTLLESILRNNKIELIDVNTPSYKNPNPYSKWKNSRNKK